MGGHIKVHCEKFKAKDSSLSVITAQKGNGQMVKTPLAEDNIIHTTHFSSKYTTSTA